MNEFIGIAQQVFPAITNDVAVNTIKAIRESFKGKSYEFCIPPFDLQAQADIYTTLPFRFLDHDGNLRSLSARGLLLTNTCDTDRDERLSFAAMIPVKEYTDRGQNETSIKQNEFTSLMYIPSTVADVGDYVVDLTIINSFSRFQIEKAIEAGKVQRVATLNQFGYYMFLLKLTVFFMRPEDPDTHEMR